MDDGLRLLIPCLSEFLDVRVFFLGAANATEVAKENEELGHGGLTSGILEGLSTGLADKDNDGQVSGNDLFRWCADYAQRRGSQRVVMTGQAESSEVIVAYSRRRIAPELIERLRANIATAYTQEWLPQRELDELRDYYLVPQIVVVPPPPGAGGDAGGNVRAGRLDPEGQGDH